ncbi:MAG: LysM peptidoglycan-binding domain-containing protein [Halieaceae bacterium]|nr:LysM peptidoglycan-binding domain-containing protein [Halieaceae bacterium]
MFRVVLAIALLLSSLHAGAGDFPRPASLEPAVQFWIRVYTEITTNQGYIHDAVDMSVIYETVELPNYASNSKRDQLVKDAKARIALALTHIAKGKRSKLSDTEARVLAAWPEGTPASAFKQAADNVRFQLGQSNRFKEGMVRSGQWKPHIRQVLAAHKLPPELEVLPHVESSFNPAVYSKVAAAGMWQFMPATARNYMRVDHVVDARLDPFIATEGAAKLLKRNYDVTGTWPLALTAYNHGTTGMVRAANAVGTRDIGTIVQQYKGSYFGFASRNFYASFLAALEVDRNAGRYFGPVQLDAPTAYEEVVLSDYIPARALAQSAGISLDELRAHNPALRDPIWNGEKHIPVGQLVRVPRAQLNQPLDTLLAALPRDARFGDQKPDVLHRIAPGDSLSTIAARYGTTVSKLMALNGLRKHNIRAGKTLILPGNTTSEQGLAGRSGAPASAGEGHVEYVIRRGDSLWSIARRFNVSQQQLVAWNGISPKGYIQPGQKLRVPSSI